MRKTRTCITLAAVFAVAATLGIGMRALKAQTVQARQKQTGEPQIDPKVRAEKAVAVAEACKKAAQKWTGSPFYIETESWTPCDKRAQRPNFTTRIARTADGMLVSENKSVDSFEVPEIYNRRVHKLNGEYTSMDLNVKMKSSGTVSLEYMLGSQLDPETQCATPLVTTTTFVQEPIFLGFEEIKGVRTRHNLLGDPKGRRSERWHAIDFGCVPVRAAYYNVNSQTGEAELSSTVELVRAEHKDPPKDLIEEPAGMQEALPSTRAEAILRRQAQLSGKADTPHDKEQLEEAISKMRASKSGSDDQYRAAQKTK